MKSTILSLAAILVMFTSCKDDKKSETEVVAPKDLPFTITVNAIVEKDDTFQVFFNEDGKESYAPEDAITVNVTGKPQSQDIVFTLPEEITPMSLRFDVGANKDLGQVKVNGFTLNYLDASFNGTSAQFFKSFYPNDNAEFDVVNNTIKLKSAEGKPYDPILGATVDLKTEMTKLINKAQGK